MKNADDARLLAHKRRFDAKRREAAIAKKDAATIAAIHKVAAK